MFGAARQGKDILMAIDTNLIEEVLRSPGEWMPWNYLQRK